jgi:hypothetical protein
MLLSRDDILKVDDRRYEEVEVPEWNGTVRLRSLTGAEYDTYQQSCIQQKGDQRKVNMRNARAKLILLCAVDTDGNQLFGEADLAALGRKNAKPIDRLFEACQKLVGMSEEDLEEMTEGFVDAQSDD